MTFKIYRYNDIDGNTLFKLVKKFEFDFSSVKNFFLGIRDRVVVGPNAYSGGRSFPAWWNTREQFINKQSGRLNTSVYPRIEDLDKALEICNEYYIEREKRKLINKKIKLFLKPLEVQIINGKDIIIGDKNEI